MSKSGDKDQKGPKRILPNGEITERHGSIGMEEMGSRSGINKVKKVAAAVGSKERRTDGEHMTSIPGDRGSHSFLTWCALKVCNGKATFCGGSGCLYFHQVLMKPPHCFLAMLQWRFDGHQQPLINSFTLSRWSSNENKLTAATVDLDNVNGQNGGGVAGIFIDWMGKSYLFFEGCTLTLACFTF